MRWRGPTPEFAAWADGMKEPRLLEHSDRVKLRHATSKAAGQWRKSDQPSVRAGLASRYGLAGEWRSGQSPKNSFRWILSDFPVRPNNSAQSKFAIFCAQFARHPTECAFRAGNKDRWFFRAIAPLIPFHTPSNRRTEFTSPVAEVVGMELIQKFVSDTPP
jgi:hypothetical protein